MGVFTDWYERHFGVPFEDKSPLPEELERFEDEGGPPLKDSDDG